MELMWIAKCFILNLICGESQIILVNKKKLISTKFSQLLGIEDTNYYTYIHMYNIYSIYIPVIIRSKYVLAYA